MSTINLNFIVSINLYYSIEYKIMDTNVLIKKKKKKNKKIT